MKNIKAEINGKHSSDAQEINAASNYPKKLTKTIRIGVPSDVHLTNSVIRDMLGDYLDHSHVSPIYQDTDGCKYDNIIDIQYNAMIEHNQVEAEFRSCRLTDSQYTKLITMSHLTKVPVKYLTANIINYLLDMNIVYGV